MTRVDHLEGLGVGGAPRNCCLEAATLALRVRVDVGFLGGIIC